MCKQVSSIFPENFIEIFNVWVTKFVSFFPKISFYKFKRMLKSKIDVFQRYLSKDWLICEVRFFKENKSIFIAPSLLYRVVEKCFEKDQLCGLVAHDIDIGPAILDHYTSIFHFPFILRFTIYLISTMPVFFINSNELIELIKWFIHFT